MSAADENIKYRAPDHRAYGAFNTAVGYGFSDELQEAACTDTWYAYRFAISVVGADIDYCKQHMGEYLEWYLKNQMKDALK